MKGAKSTYAFLSMLRKLMTQYGGMGYSMKCEKWVLKVRCGEWLGLSMLMIGVVSFSMVNLLGLFPMDREGGG